MFNLPVNFKLKFKLARRRRPEFCQWQVCQ